MKGYRVVVTGLGFEVKGRKVRVWGLGFGVWGLEFKVYTQVLGLGFRVQDSGLGNFYDLGFLILGLRKHSSGFKVWV